MNSPRLKQMLLQTGVLSDPQMAQAEQQAAAKNVSLLRALLDLRLVSFEQLGTCLGEMCQLPYVPLLDHEPLPQASSFLSQPCALHWKVFPVAYDAEQFLLTLAVHDTAQIRKMENINRFFMQHHGLAFTIAAETEIEQALDRYLGGRFEAAAAAAGGSSEPAAPRPPAARKIDTSAVKPRAAMRPVVSAAPAHPEEVPQEVYSRRTSSLLSRPHATSPGRGSLHPSYHRAAKEKELLSAEMRRTLISAAQLLVSAHLGDDTEEMAQARERVRHCQLLAARCNLDAEAMDRVVMGAWMSALASRRQVIKQFVTPYNLVDLVFPEESAAEDAQPEARIIGLVGAYQQLKVSDPDGCRDVNLARRHLRAEWSASPADQAMLEAFLQLLMDEEFLATLARAAGRILVVDTDELRSPSMSPLLINDGYDVTVVETVESAHAYVSSAVPDLVVVGMNLADGRGVDMCRRLRRVPSTASVPILMVLDADAASHAAECLRAGASDFVMRPLDMELLMLKIVRMMGAVTGDAGRMGVSGSLADMNFSDMIQILSVGGKSMEIVVSSGGEEGHVYIHDGEVVHAAVGDLHAEAAFYRMMQWHEGSFETRQCSEFPARTILSSTMSLLMEGARQADEQQLPSGSEG